MSKHKTMRARALLIVMDALQKRQSDFQHSGSEESAAAFLTAFEDYVSLIRGELADHSKLRDEPPAFDTDAVLRRRQQRGAT